MREYRLAGVARGRPRMPCRRRCSGARRRRRRHPWEGRDRRRPRQWMGGGREGLLLRRPAAVLVRRGPAICHEQAVALAGEPRLYVGGLWRGFGGAIPRSAVPRRLREG